jgi:hypothetical protein
VVLIASDGFTSPAVSNLFRLRGDAAAFDELTVAVGITPIDSWDIQSEFDVPNLWGFAGIAGGGAQPVSGQTATELTITTAADTTNSFAFWQMLPGASGLFAVNGGDLVRARFTISSNQSPAGWVASWMRVFQENIQVTAQLATEPIGSSVLPPANTNRSYDIFYQPPAGLVTNLTNVAFWIIDTNPSVGGTFLLDSVEVDQISGLGGLFSPVDIIDAGETTDFTAAGLGSPGAPTWNSNQTTDAVSITLVSHGATPSFAFWQFNDVVVSMPANTLYRVTHTLSTTSGASAVPEIKLSSFPADNSERSLVEILQNGGTAAHMPTASGVDYVQYLPSQGIDGLNLFLAFDLRDVNTGLSGTVSWDRIVVESVDLGLIP